jgi:hypothetical protein
VVLACFTLLSAVFSISLAGVLSAANWLCLDLTLKLTRFFAGLPVAKLSLPAPSLSFFAVYYLSLWLFFGWVGSKKRSHLFWLLMLANLFVWSRAFSGDARNLRISLLDAGSGSVAVMEIPGGQTFVINAGEKTESLDAAEYIVAPFLNHGGINRVDGLILTDRNPLNLSAAASLLQNRQVSRAFVTHLPLSGDSLDADGTGMWQTEFVLLDSIRDIGDQDDELFIRFLRYPSAGNPVSTADERLVKIVYREISFCFFDGMKKASFSSGFDWSQVRNCSVLVLSELGDEKDIRAIIAAARPQRVVFTRHYARYEKDKIPLLMALDFPDMEYYRTAQGGAIICRTQGREVTVETTLR